MQHPCHGGRPTDASGCLRRRCAVAGDDVPHQAFRLGRNAWGVQFHFEVDGPGVEAWLRVSEPALARDWKKTSDEVREELRTYLDAQQLRSRALLAAFAHQLRVFRLHGQIAE